MIDSGAHNSVHTKTSLHARYIHAHHHVHNLLSHVFTTIFNMKKVETYQMHFISPEKQNKKFLSDPELYTIFQPKGERPFPVISDFCPLFQPLKTLLQKQNTKLTEKKV